MKKRVIFCLLVCGFGFAMPASAISEEQKTAIVENCEVIRDNLKNVQRIDARARVFLGSHYETVLAKFMTPLNVRLVENNMSNTSLIENQSMFATTKVAFVNDFVSYQQELEALVAMNCRAEPENFYKRLQLVREKRKIVAGDLAKMRELTLKNIELTQRLKRKL